MRIEIDGERCTGHARCAAVAPELFELDDIGFGVVRPVGGEVAVELAASAERTVFSCPERAITLIR